MKIAVNARFWQPRLEGLGRHLVGVLSEWVLLRPDVHFVLFFDSPPKVDWKLGSNVSMRVVHPPARHPLLFYIWYEWAIPAALKAEQADIFWSPDNFCSLRSTCPTILTIHDLAYRHYPEQIVWVHRLYNRFFQPRFVASAKKIIAVSDFTKQDLIQQYGTDPQKISIAHNACDQEIVPLSKKEIQHFRELKTQGRPYFLYFGALHPRKNIVQLLLAFKVFQEQSGCQYPLVLLGRSAWKTNEIEQIISQMSPDSVIQLGYLPDIEAQQWLQAALALTYISLFEGFGMPVLEALQAGVPVLTSTDSAMSEIVGPAALCVPPQNTEAIAAALFKLSSESSQRDQLIVAGLLRAKDFSWAKAAETYNLVANQLFSSTLHPR